MTLNRVFSMANCYTMDNYIQVQSLPSSSFDVLACLDDYVAWMWWMWTTSHGGHARRGGHGDSGGDGRR